MSLASGIAMLAAVIRDKLNTMTPRLIPSGGAQGQVLAKASGTTYDAAWVPAGARPAVKSATITVPGPAGQIEYNEIIVDASLAGTERILVMLDPSEDADENSPELLDLVNLTAIAGVGYVQFNLTFSNPTSGPIRLLYQAL